jgi:hypothetical protein
MEAHKARRPRELPYAVAPVPNRMVIIPGYIEHCVSLVSDIRAPQPGIRLCANGNFPRFHCDRARVGRGL